MPNVMYAVCNYAKGKWVEDNHRPLYSGFGCKQWLSDMWACRLTQRTNFSYEGYRWQPQSCEMPEFEQSEFFKRYIVQRRVFFFDLVSVNEWLFCEYLYIVIALKCDSDSECRTKLLLS